MNETKGYKGFDKDLKCRGFQYEVGNEYEENETPKCCDNGFHFCGYPLDVLKYYGPVDEKGNLNRFCEVKGIGEIDKNGEDTKVSTNKIKIGAELNFQQLTKASIDFVYEHTKNEPKLKDSNTGNRSVSSNTGYYSVSSNTGIYSVSSNTGYCSVSSNTGNRSVSSNTGDYSVSSNTGNYSVSSNIGNRSVSSNTGNYSVSSNTGENGIASSLGPESKAKGIKGTWLILAEWIHDENYNYVVKNVKTIKIDGKKIKENTLYQLINGEFIEVSDDNDWLNSNILKKERRNLKWI